MKKEWREKVTLLTANFVWAVGKFSSNLGHDYSRQKQLHELCNYVKLLSVRKIIYELFPQKYIPPRLKSKSVQLGKSLKKDFGVKKSQPIFG